MIEGYYAAVSAMSAMMAEQQIIGNNIANLNTIGYKQDIAQETEFERILFRAVGTRTTIGQAEESGNAIARLGTGIELLPTALDLTTGPLVTTDRPLDLALPNSGFFRVLDAAGEATYVRAGTFMRDTNGTVVTPEGEALTDIEGEPILLGPGAVVISDDGSIRLDEQFVAQIAIVDLPDGLPWRKVGRGHFQPHDPTAQPELLASPGVLQGYLEQSNVNPDQQVVEMMSVLRVYEAAQSILGMADEGIAQAVREVGRVR
jgi:flagellar basal-body rod protein FlgF